MYKNEINNDIDHVFEQKLAIFLEKLEEDEVAKEIEGYEKRYAITNKARVYSFIQGKYLTPQVGGNGYMHVCLSNGIKTRNIELHILVAKAFCMDSWQEGYEVLHLDDDPCNNLPSNLRFGTHKENCNMGDRNKKISAALKKQVINLDTGEVYDSAKDAAEITGVNRNSISQACNGKYKRAGGYRWGFVGVA